MRRDFFSGSIFGGLFFALAFSGQSAESAKPGAKAVVWEPDYESALAKAKSEKKDLFVFVDGSDWSEASRVYKQSVISSPRLALLGDDYLFLEVDYPDSPTAEQKELAKKNGKFTGNWQNFVQSYPGVLLLDSEGRCYTKWGTPQGGAEQLVVAVQGRHAARVKRDAEWGLAEKAVGREKARHLGAGLDLVCNSIIKPYDYFRTIVEEIKKADPDDTDGYYRRATFSFDAFNEHELGKLLHPEKKFAEALALVEKELADRRNSVEMTPRFLAARFQILQRAERLDEAMKTLQQIIAMDPKSELAQGARGYLENITQPITLKGPRWKPEYLRFFFADWWLNVGGEITAAGSYEIEFKRETGDSIVVKDVALLVGKQELVAAEMPKDKSVVRLKVGELPPGQKSWLRIRAKGTGWFGAYGDILIRKVD